MYTVLLYKYIHTYIYACLLPYNELTTSINCESLSLMHTLKTSEVLTTGLTNLLQLESRSSYRRLASGLPATAPCTTRAENSQTRIVSTAIGDMSTNNLSEDAFRDLLTEKDVLGAFGAASSSASVRVSVDARLRANSLTIQASSSCDNTAPYRKGRSHVTKKLGIRTKYIKDFISDTATHKQGTKIITSNNRIWFFLSWMTFESPKSNQNLFSLDNFIIIPI